MFGCLFGEIRIFHTRSKQLMVLCDYTQPLFKMHDCVKCMGIVRRFVKCIGIVRRFVKCTGIVRRFVKCIGIVRRFVKCMGMLRSRRVAKCICMLFLQLIINKGQEKTLKKH